MNLWESPPFEATVRDGEIYARGAADDKGQVFMHLKALEAHLKQHGKLPINVKLIIEGEEEVGSVNLDNFIRANKASLAADVVIISDSAMFDRGVPSICYSLRGLVYFQLDLRGTKSDLHSGIFGGAVANPNMVLAQILAQMKDRGGRIKIPGFYDDVLELKDEERKAWTELPFDERRYRKDLGAPKLFGESGYTTLERVWGRPTFEGERVARWIHRRRREDGDSGGVDGEGQHASRAESAPRQDRAALRDVCEESGAQDGGRESDAHARRQAMDHRLRQSVRAGRRSRESSRVSANHPCSAARADRFPWCRRSRKSSACRPCCSASVCRTRTRMLPNERLDLANFHNGIVASALLYEELRKG